MNSERMSGLDFVGVLETCDLCGDEYPMSWIIYTGKQFLCYACAFQKEGE